MKCPFCYSLDTGVRDSRLCEDDTSIRRRRFCELCKQKFTTFEKVHLKTVKVIKRDGRSVLFDRSKLMRSIVNAVHKSSMDVKKVEHILGETIQKIESLGDSEVKTEIIGSIVLSTLKSHDPVAYIRFASVYKEFNSVENFISLIKEIENS